MYGRRKLVSTIFFIICVFLIFGCAAPDFYKMDDSEPIHFTEDVEPVQVLFVKDYLVVQDDLEKMSDDIKIQMDLSDLVTLTDFFLIMSKSAKIQFSYDIVKKIQVTESKDGKEPQISNMISDKILVLGKYKGSLKGLLSMVQKTSGLFFNKVGDGYVVKDEAVCVLRVLPQQNIEDMQTMLTKTFKVSDAVVDSRSGKIVFRANYHQFKDVSDYLKLYPVSVGDIDIIFTEAEISDENSVGLDVETFTLALEKAGELTTKFSITGLNGFTLKAQSGVASISGTIKSLQKYAKHNILQRVSVSAMTNQSAVVDVSEKIPYVQKVTSTSGTVGSAVRGYEFQTVSSGVTIDVKPVIDKDVLLLQSDLKYQHVTDYLIVGTTDDEMKYPVVTARNVKNVVAMQPGDITKLATIRYKRKGRSTSGVYGFSRLLFGADYRDYEINVFGRVIVKRYIFQ